MTTELKDVFWQIRKEGYVASAEGVGQKESLKIGAGNRRDFPANAVEVGADGVFVGEFLQRKMDISTSPPKLGGRNA